MNVIIQEYMSIQVLECYDIFDSFYRFQLVHHTSHYPQVIFK